MATFIRGSRTSYDTTTETRNVRDVSNRIFRYLDHSLLYFKGGTTIGPEGKSVKVPSRIKSQRTTAVKFEWQEKDVFQQPNLIASGTISSSATTFDFDADSDVRVGDAFRVNDENIVFTALASTTQGTIVRIGGTADTIGDNATLKAVGNLNTEGAGKRAVRSGDFNFLDNNTSIIRTPVGETGTESEIKKYEDQSSERELIMEGGIQHATELEKQILFGTKNLGTATTRRMMDGLIGFLTTNVYSSTSGGYSPVTSVAAPSYTGGAGHGTNGLDFDEFIEEFAPTLFRYNDPSKKRTRVMVGGHIIPIMWKEWMKDNATVEIDMLKDEIGFDVQLIRTPFGMFEYAYSGSVELIEPGFAFVIEPRMITYRFIPNRDTRLLMNRQANDADEFVHEFMTEAGIQVEGERLMGLIKNLVRGTL